MLATLGDLVEDMVVRLDGPIRPASDTLARITRRRGGSAANVAEAAARIGRPVRFIGQVGEDAIGRSLVAELAAAGVDVSPVRYAGATGTIVVLVDERGERSMLTDRRACLELDSPDKSWLDGVTTLHVPLYSLVEPPLSDTAIALIDGAHRLDIDVSIDVSSVSLIDGFPQGALVSLLNRLSPTVILANVDEAGAFGPGPIGDSLTIVKRGPRPALVYRPDHQPVEVPAVAVTQVVDTTGAGDAFAAGFLTTANWAIDPGSACEAGHRTAADLISRRLGRSGRRRSA